MQPVPVAKGYLHRIKEEFIRPLRDGKPVDPQHVADTIADCRAITVHGRPSPRTVAKWQRLLHAVVIELIKNKYVEGTAAIRLADNVDKLRPTPSL